MSLAFTAPSLCSTLHNTFLTSSSSSALTSSSFTRSYHKPLTHFRVCPRFRFGVARVTMMTAATADDETIEAEGANETEAAQVEAGAEGEEEQKTVADDPNRAKGILMLCLGNICRSPAAEAVMNRVLSDRGLSEKYFVESCGTGGGSPDWYMEDGHSHHVGSYPDIRMQYAAEERGYTLESRSRPLTKDDFERFDYIVAMDSSNIEALETARNHWGVDEQRAKVMLMSEFSSDESFRGKGVPDPYYSGQDGFNHALDLILDACNGLAEFLVKPASS